MKSKPVIISAPEPRTLDLIFTADDRDMLEQRYDITEMPALQVDRIGDELARNVRYIIGQPDLSENTLTRMQNLQAIFNVESNLVNNMPYDYLFARGIYVLTTGRVFAQPVAEMGLAMALCLARDVVSADVAFRQGNERWGGESNQHARLLFGSNIGLIGFGDLGRAIAQLLSGFRAAVSVYDPWLPDSTLVEAGVKPTSLNDIMSTSDTVFVVASVTSDNQHFINADLLDLMKHRASLILLSRAEVVDFDELMRFVADGKILVASDVFPDEPLHKDHPVRKLDGFIRSAHRAGALDSAFKQMGRLVLDDMHLMDRTLPPVRCKRAERETVGRMRSAPVTSN